VYFNRYGCLARGLSLQRRRRSAAFGEILPLSFEGQELSWAGGAVFDAFVSDKVCA